MRMRRHHPCRRTTIDTFASDTEQHRVVYLQIKTKTRDDWQTATYAKATLPEYGLMAQEWDASGEYLAWERLTGDGLIRVQP